MTSKRYLASVLASALIAGLGMTQAMAQGNSTPRIDQAQQDISARIQQGMASGHITPSEAQVLLRRERDIQMRENQYKANGSANPQERQQLRADLGALSADVERMMSNRNVTSPANPNGYNPNAPRQPGSHYTDRVNMRELRIGQRIDEGIRSGRISQREARELHRRQRELERREARAYSDGVVSVPEQRQLRNEIMALRDEVERMMRNDRRGRG
ncbi:MAG: hypothetical protein JWR60_4359 [Polaromonas sp.]|nr:hypothetical protein [Polaromonas sp.]